MIVRRATLEDKAEIFAFIDDAWGDRAPYKFPERWEWQFENNPFREDDLLPVWIAVDEEDGKVVGQTCAMVEPLQIGDELYRVGWSVDTFLQPSCRGQGIGYELQKANNDANEIFMSLSMSAANRRIKEALGSIPLCPVTKLLKWLHHDSTDVMKGFERRIARKKSKWGEIATTIFRNLALDKIFAMALNVRISLLELFGGRNLSVDESIEIIRVERFPEEIDALWEEISPNFHASIKRDQRYLNWKYVEKPHREYFNFIAIRNDRLCGYIILREGKEPEPNMGLIVDIFVSPSDEKALSTLMVFAQEYLKRRRVGFIKTATTVEAYQKRLLRLGYKKIGDVIPMFHANVQSKEIESAIKSKKWLLGKGDHDWDQYPPP